MLVHRLFRLQLDALATHIDMVCRWVIPAILYPLITLASLCKGLSAQHAWRSDMQIILLAAGVPLTLVFIAWRVRTSSRYSRDSRHPRASVTDRYITLPMLPHDVIAQVRTNYLSIGKLQARCLREFADTREDNAEWAHRARALFDAFDLDQSGSINFKEMRAVVKLKCARRVREHISLAHQSRAHSACAECAWKRVGWGWWDTAWLPLAGYRLSRRRGGRVVDVHLRWDHTRWANSIGSAGRCVYACLRADSWRVVHTRTNQLPCEPWRHAGTRTCRIGLWRRRCLRCGRTRWTVRSSRTVSSTP